MSYSPKYGDFGIIKSKGLAARLIQLGTISRWNHAFIYIGDGNIIEARPKEGVVIRPLSEYDKIAWNQHENLSDKQRKQIVDKAHALLGRAYGFLDIIILGIRILSMGIKVPLLHFIHLKFLEKLALRQGIICSELVAICYESAGITLINKPEYLVTPGDLAEYLIYQ